jgi:hypothetical protein
MFIVSSGRSQSIRTGTSRRKCRLHDVERLDEDAETRERGTPDDLAVVAVERRRDANGLRRIALVELQRIEIVARL